MNLLTFGSLTQTQCTVVNGYFSSEMGILRSFIFCCGKLLPYTLWYDARYCVTWVLLLSPDELHDRASVAHSPCKRTFR